MSMGYASVQGYTGSPSNPIAPTSGFRFNSSDVVKVGSKAALGLGRSWANWQNSVGTEEQLRRAERDALYNADQTKRRTAYEAWRNDVYARRVMGQKRNALGVAGVDMSGAAIDVLVSTIEELTLDKEVAIAEGKTQEAAYRAEAWDAKKAAKREKRNRSIGLGMDWITTGLEIAGAII